MDKFNLKQILAHFSDIGEKRWGQTLELDRLEKTFIPIKEGKKDLSMEHLEAIRDDYAFANWWKMPDICEEDLSLLKGIFINLKPFDKKVIEKLFDLLKNIEIVSCVLRSVDPYNYGIMSPPVENILNVRGTNKIKKYLNYLRNLRELQEPSGFDRIADVDMALWTLANIINNSDLRHHNIYSDFYDNYEQTANPVKKIMARNSLEQIRKENPLFKADLFLDSDYVVAGLVAGRELELLIKGLCKENGIKLKEKKGNKVRYFYTPELAEKLMIRKLILKEELENIEKWWEYRCDLTHVANISCTFDDVKSMIAGITELKDKYKI